MEFGTDKCTRWYGADMRGGRVVFRSHSQEPTGETLQGTMQTFAAEPQPAAGGAEPEDSTKKIGGSKKVPMPRAKSTSRSLASSKSFNPNSRTKQAQKERWLLDDRHEAQAFRNDVGAAFALEKQLKEQGMVALKSGRGYAVTVEPKSDWLPPFGKMTVTCTCYSDIPGLMEDDLIIEIGKLQSHADGGDYRIPMRVVSKGNPLFLPDQQVGLNNTLETPSLLIETITPAHKYTTRTIKVGNNSMSPVALTWKIMSQLQVKAIEDFKLAKAKAAEPPEPPPIEEEPEKADGEEGQQELTEEEAAERDAAAAAAEAAGDAPPEAEAAPAADAEGADGGAGELPEGAEGDEGADQEAQGENEETEVQQEPVDADVEPIEEVPPVVEDPFALENGQPPIRIEPDSAILPVQGQATFTVTMVASKATLTAEGHYQYQLIGEGRYTDAESSKVKIEEVAAPVQTKAPGAELTQKPNIQPSRLAQGVAKLPEIALDQKDLLDDDSDKEEVPPTPESEYGLTKRFDVPGEPEKPEADVIANLLINCVGDCVIPRLIVDKKGDPSTFEFADGDERNVPVFKFVHSTVDMPQVGNEDRTRAHPGVKLHGQAGGTPHQGIGSCLLREVTMANENGCIIYCRFRTEGPFRIKMVEQAAKKPVHPLVVEKPKKGQPPKEPVDDPLAQLFAVPPRTTITLQVEFVPGMVKKSEWTHNVRHIFRGDVVIEYQRDPTNPASKEMDLQRVHLMSSSNKPSLKLNLIPHVILDPPAPLPRAEQPPWHDQDSMLIEFGFVHVESSVKRTRTIILNSENNVVARWRIFHVGRKRRPPLEIGVTAREDEDFRALDNREAFSFDVSDGEIHGPSKDVLVPGEEERKPRWCPVTPALPKRLPHHDEHRFEPQRVVITFKPDKNEVYKCRFRIQIEDGKSIDFICHGCGSYDEEDDAMEYQEA